LETLKVGDIILGKYEVTGVLGQGGMGIVLAAMHRELGEPVALKFLRPSLRSDPEASTRFIQEARAGKRIKDRHVATVYDVDTVDGVPFMVMEHLTGDDLSTVIRKRGQLPIAESADLLLQACEAIDEAHALGIVHRDLKPANLFVTTHVNGTPLVKVLDFGISKSTATSDMSVTASTTVMGTPLYMSPEQFTSARSVDPRSDIWSLGVILYELLTGTPPFPGATRSEVCTAVLKGAYTRPTRRRPEVPPSLEQLISLALVRDREKRLPSVAAFAARLMPFGTEAGRLSHDRIQRLASRAPVPSERPVEPDGFKTSPPKAAGTEETSAGHVTAAPAESAVPPRDKTEPRPSRWPRFAVLGVVAAAAASAIVLPRFRQSRLDASLDSAAAASMDPTRTDAANAAECASGATAQCEAACTANRPGSCQKLAEALEKGLGAPRDIAKAAALYQTACDSGSAAACNNLGALYAQGDGVPRDGAKAVALYTRACDQGSATSCVNLGAMHFEGNGVPKNESLGARFFLRGCEAGEPMGCFNVSVAYGEGRGVPKDGAQSLAFADRACTMGARAGCVRTALAKIAGEGVAKDVKAGLAQLDAMCTRHESVGCESLAKLYMSGAGADVPADPLRVREYAKKACDLGSQRYCGANQLLGNVDSADSTMARANALFQTKCDAGDLVACGMLGERLLGGAGTSVDRARGTALLKKACQGGFDRACKKLGESGTP
jgi:serine/threonine protein kinase/TPR repeat protein